MNDPLSFILNMVLFAAIVWRSKDVKTAFQDIALVNLELNLRHYLPTSSKQLPVQSQQ